MAHGLNLDNFDLILLGLKVSGADARGVASASFIPRRNLGTAKTVSGANLVPTSSGAYAAEPSKRSSDMIENREKL